MKFVKTIMAAALLTTALSTSVFAGGREAQAGDTEDSLGYVGFTAANAVARKPAAVKLGGPEAIALFNTDAGTAFDPAQGTDGYTKGVKAFLVAVKTKAIADLRIAAPTVLDTDDKAIAAIVKALTAKPLEGKFSDKQLRPDGTWIAAAEEGFAKAIVALANPISAEEVGLLSAQKMALKTKGMVDATEVSIADLVADMVKGGADKAKALAAAKKFKPLDAARNGVSLADLIIKKKAERAQGRLATADEETLGYVAGTIRTAVGKVPVHVATAEEKFGAELVKELQKAIAANAFPLKFKGATDADRAKNAVKALVEMYDALGVMEAEIAAHGGGGHMTLEQAQDAFFDIAGANPHGVTSVDHGAQTFLSHDTNTYTFADARLAGLAIPE